MSDNQNNSLSSVQLGLEIAVLIGYIIGLFPFLYYIVSMWIVIPLTITNLVISIIARNRTVPFTITNAIMAILSLIPILGFIFKIIGIIMSSLSISELNKIHNRKPEQKKKSKKVIDTKESNRK